MQFYLFNVTNADEVLAGGKPRLVQMGPYTYKERREKFDIVWNHNGTVTYKQNRTFTFLPDMSAGNETDLVTTVNPLIPVLAHNYHLLSSTLSWGMSWIMGDEKLFFTRPVKEVLWGYDDPVLSFANGLLPGRFPIKNIGYFMRRNFTDDGVYTVSTGAEDISTLGDVTAWNYKDSLDIWTTNSSNMINGSDGSLGPPFMFNVSESSVYVSDICRSIRGVYLQDVHVKGIRLRRFGGDPYDMANASVNPQNYGFCTPAGTPIDKCLPSGLLNSTKCQEPVNGFDLPIIFSFPHFLNADPKVGDKFIGLSPNEAEHETAIDMEPWTGLVLQVAKRLQINILVEQSPDLKDKTLNVTRMFFPILWINESSVTNDKYADMLKDQLFWPKQLAETGRVVMAIAGSALTLLCGLLLVWHHWRVTSSKHAYTRPSPGLELEDETKLPVYMDR